MVQQELYLNEVFNFLRTVTIFNSYFADQVWMNSVSELYFNRLPTMMNPYYRHLNGEYILQSTIPIDKYIECKAIAIKLTNSPIIQDSFYTLTSGIGDTRVWTSLTKDSTIRQMTDAERVAINTEAIGEQFEVDLTYLPWVITDHNGDIVYYKNGAINNTSPWEISTTWIKRDRPLDKSKVVVSVASDTDRSDAFINNSTPATCTFIDNESGRLVVDTNTNVYTKYDEMMYITSIDTHELIEFTKETLKHHPKTMAMYKLPSEYYLSLCQKYPNQVDLIKAIVYSFSGSIREVKDLIALDTLTEKNGYVWVKDVDTTENVQGALYVWSNYAYKAGWLKCSDEKIPFGSVDEYIRIHAYNSYLDELTSLTSGIDKDALITSYRTGAYTKKWIHENIELVTAMLEEYYTEITRSIASKRNYSLLSYDSTILQDNEQEVMLDAVNSYLALMSKRWDVKEYVYEELYPEVMWCSIWYNLPIILLTQRVKNIKTECVHQFHIWEYLQSKGLEDYRDVLTREQELFLYRNIDYIQGNAGKTSNLNILADNLLGRYNIELRGKSILFDITDGDKTCIKQPFIISENANTEVPDRLSMHKDIETIDGIIRREHDDKLEPVYNDTVVQEQTELLSYSKYTNLTTKLVELNKLSVHERWMQDFFQFTTDMLLYHASVNIELLDFTVNLEISDTSSSLPLTAKETIALLYYCILKTEKTRLQEPDDTRWYIPNRAKVYIPYIVDRPDTPVTVPYNGMMYPISKIFVDADAIIDSVYQIPYVVGPNDVTDNAHKTARYIQNLYSIRYKHLLTYMNRFDTLTALGWDALYQALTPDKVVEFVLVDKYQTYTDWFAGSDKLGEYIHKLESTDNPVDEYDKLITKLVDKLLPFYDKPFLEDEEGKTYVSMDFTDFLKSTGIDEYRYRKLKQLFIQLCSYNIAFLDTNTFSKSYIPTGKVTLGTGSTSSNQHSSWNHKTIIEHECPVNDHMDHDHRTVIPAIQPSIDSEKNRVVEEQVHVQLPTPSFTSHVTNITTKEGISLYKITD